MGVRPFFVAAVAAVLVVAGVQSAHAATSPSGSCEWPMYGHDTGHSFAQPDGCTTIDTTSVHTLVPKWNFLAPDSVTGSPTIVNGMAYVGDWAGNFYSFPIDAGPGPVQPSHVFHVTDADGVAFGRIVGSAAVTTVAGRDVVVIGGGATLYALDARDLTELAHLCVDPIPESATHHRCGSGDTVAEIESSPTVVRHGNSAQVVVGMDVHNDQGVGRTGILSVVLHRAGGGLALDPQWKFDPQAATSPGGGVYTGNDQLTRDAATGNGCAGVWSSPAVDTARHAIFFGTSSCSVAGVDTGESMWSISLDDGHLRWVFHPPRESTDYDDDFGASPNLLGHGLVGEGSKDGWYYALAEDGDGHGGPAVRWSSHVGESGHVENGFAVGGIIGTPAVGTVGGQQLVFVTTAISTPLDAPFDADSGPTLDQSLAQDPGRMLSLAAIRVTDGSVAWRAPLSRQSYGAPTFVNGVLLVPSTFSATIGAYDAASGLPLGSWPVPGAPSSAPVPYGDSVYVGFGTRTTDLEYKAFHADPLAGPLGPSPLSPASGVIAFRAALP